jgi:hypothetical protein
VQAPLHGPPHGAAWGKCKHSSQVIHTRDRSMITHGEPVDGGVSVLYSLAITYIYIYIYTNLKKR